MYNHCFRVSFTTLTCCSNWWTSPEGLRLSKGYEGRSSMPNDLVTSERWSRMESDIHWPSVKSMETLFAPASKHPRMSFSHYKSGWVNISGTKRIHFQPRQQRLFWIDPLNILRSLHSRDTGDTSCLEQWPLASSGDRCLEGNSFESSAMHSVCICGEWSLRAEKRL